MAQEIISRPTQSTSACHIEVISALVRVSMLEQQILALYITAILRDICIHQIDLHASVLA